ncbi:pectate lyase family protein, partial [Pseudomonas silesiensis]|uniref:pectate lyase family protein n=1 Tax=Pseudomonas silesiensis TaxID=1853130 RepID=UPI0034DA1D43
YVGGTADSVSLANSKFQNNEYGVILGQPHDSAQAKAEYKGYPRMTIANNVFSNLDVRAPGLMRHGQFDVLNNSIDNFH